MEFGMTRKCLPKCYAVKTKCLGQIRSSGRRMFVVNLICVILYSNLATSDSVRGDIYNGEINLENNEVNNDPHNLISIDMIRKYNIHLAKYLNIIQNPGKVINKRDLTIINDPDVVKRPSEDVEKQTHDKHHVDAPSDDFLYSENNYDDFVLNLEDKENFDRLLDMLSRPGPAKLYKEYEPGLRSHGSHSDDAPHAPNLSVRPVPHRTLANEGSHFDDIDGMPSIPEDEQSRLERLYFESLAADIHARDDNDEDDYGSTLSHGGRARAVFSRSAATTTMAHTFWFHVIAFVVLAA